jgi:hypothetical protein
MAVGTHVRVQAARPRSRGRVTQSVTTRALLTSFFEPRRGQRSANRKQELLDQLLGLTDDCDGGFKTKLDEHRQIADIVKELNSYCPQNPVSSPRLFGRWEVRYASKPTTAGGPFRSPLGRALFPGQQASQTIVRPNVCVNELTFKTLGFLPGKVTQEGTIEAIDGNTFEITFPGARKKLGGPSTRAIELIFLDDDIRIARAVPREDGQEGSFYVLTRADDGAETVSREREELAEGRAAAKERKAAAKELYVQLSAGAREATLEAQATAKELSALERDATRILRDAVIARRAIDKAEGAEELLAATMEESQADEVALEKELLAAQRELNELRSEVLRTKKSLSPVS